MPNCNVLFIDIIHNFLSEQNRQLFKEIAKNEKLDYALLCKTYIKPRSHFHNELITKAMQESTFVAPK